MRKLACSWLVAVTGSIAVVAATTPALGDSLRPPSPAHQLSWVGESAGFQRLRAVTATSLDRAFAVGSYGIYQRGRIKAWDGQSWTNAKTSIGKDGYLQAVDAVTSSDAWAVGSYSDKRAGTGLHALTVHWDGARWRVVRGRQPGEEKGLSDVSMSSSDDGWAVGQTNNVPHEEDAQTLVEHWDGDRWTEMSSPNPDSHINSLQAVAALAPDDVWAAGYSGVSIDLLMLH